MKIEFDWNLIGPIVVALYYLGVFLKRKKPKDMKDEPDTSEEKETELDSIPDIFKRIKKELTENKDNSSKEVEATKKMKEHKVDKTNATKNKSSNSIILEKKRLLRQTKRNLEQKEISNLYTNKNKEINNKSKFSFTFNPQNIKEYFIMNEILNSKYNRL